MRFNLIALCSRHDVIPKPLHSFGRHALVQPSAEVLSLWELPACKASAASIMRL